MAMDAAARTPMERQPGYLIRRAHQVHDALWATHVGQNATPTQFAVLNVLALHGPCGLSTVAALASLDTSTAGDVVLRLADRGWVSATPSPVDRRRNVLRLTDAGAAHYERLTTTAAALTEDFVAPLSPHERELLAELLQRVIGGAADP